MPDGVSTIDYILLSGVVVNYSDIIKKELNKTKRKPKNIEKKYVQFINNCIYPKNKSIDPVKLSRWDCNRLCPISPSKSAKEYVDKYLVRILN